MRRSLLNTLRLGSCLKQLYALPASTVLPASISSIKCRSFSSHYQTNPDMAASAIHNIQSIVTKWTEKFHERGISEPSASAELIVAHVLGCKTLHGIAPWQIVSIDKTKKINELCMLRLTRMPVQYIIEEWDFRDLVLQMKPPVLIPRPETEELITYIKNYINIHDVTTPQRLLDIGCGCGAIALSLAKEYPLSLCTAVDQNPVACELTSKNANNHGIQNVHVENVRLSDSTVQEHDVFKVSYDLIVSNPPYIKSDDLNKLATEISDFEDVSGALDGGEDGLSVVKTIMKNARFFMNENSLLWLEVDSTHPKQVESLAVENLDWKLKYLKTYKDYLDRPRFCLLKAHNSD